MAEKRVVVKLLGEAKDEYLKLSETVTKEMQSNTGSSLHQTLLRSINSKIALLKTNYDYGIQIPRKLIPHRYAAEYGVTNLWKVDLSNYWRLIYTLRQPQREETSVEIIEIYLDILDIFDHDKYNKVFGYRKK